MKTTCIAMTAFALVSGLASCTTGSGENTASVLYPTINLVTDLQNDNTVAQVGSYNFSFNLDQATCAITSDNLYFGSASHRLILSPVTYTAGFYEGTDGSIGEIDSMNGATGVVDNNPEYEVMDFKCKLTSLFYTNTIAPALNYGYIQGPMLIMQYKLGNRYEVKTFPGDALYAGQTVTQYPLSTGQMTSFTNPDVKYRVRINYKEWKATVVLCDVKLAAEMPVTIAYMVLKDLPVTFSNGGYDIAGTNLIASTIEGSQLTPNDTFPFDSFSMRVEGDLTMAHITFDVTNKMNNSQYKGRFDGRYTVEPKAPK